MVIGNPLGDLRTAVSRMMRGRQNGFGALACRMGLVGGTGSDEAAKFAALNYLQTTSG